MLAEERYEKILEILSEQNSVKSSYLIDLFNVSVETVRRDLEYLEKENLIKRVHGGAVLSHVTTKNAPYIVRKNMHNEQKSKIAENAIHYIKEGNSIALDNGTTTMHLAELIKGNFNHLTVVTNSLLVANTLYEDNNINVLLLGGTIDPKNHSLMGPLTEKNIEMFHFDKAFISVSGVSLENGITDFDFNYIHLQKKFLDYAKEKIVLADSSKFNVSSLMTICDLKDIDRCITDPDLPDSIYDKLTHAGYSIIR